jgi:enoyl-CoA hydratase
MLLLSTRPNSAWPIMTYSTLEFDLHDGVALVTVNRPDKLNALNDLVIRELGHVATRLHTDAEIKGAVITGAGEKAFVAGADITELASLDRTSGATLATRGQGVFRQLETAGKPVIAAVNGFALGGGCELAMACHLRFASPNAKFGQPEVKLGLIPGYGGTVRLPRLIGRGRALELLLSGNMIEAAEAYRIGLVNRVVEQDALVMESTQLLRTILAQGPLAVRCLLETVDAVEGLSLDQALAIEAARFGDCCGTADKREGTQAFLEKRTPQFSGT